MYFRTLALEEKESDPLLTVLNYAPGPVQTEMTNEVENNAVASDVREIFKTMRVDKTILQPIDTVNKFIQVIETGDYESGAHIDYYDWADHKPIAAHLKNDLANLNLHTGHYWASFLAEFKNTFQ